MAKIRSSKIHSHYVAELRDYTDAETRYGDTHPKITEWCTQTFGTEDCWGADPISGWKRMTNRYYFTDEQNLELFVLRWSTV